MWVQVPPPAPQKLASASFFVWAIVAVASEFLNNHPVRCCQSVVRNVVHLVCHVAMLDLGAPWVFASSPGLTLVHFDHALTPREVNFSVIGYNVGARARTSLPHRQTALKWLVSTASQCSGECYPASHTCARPGPYGWSDILKLSTVSRATFAHRSPLLSRPSEATFHLLSLRTAVTS